MNVAQNHPAFALLASRMTKWASLSSMDASGAILVRFLNSGANRLRPEYVGQVFLTGRSVAILATLKLYHSVRLSRFVVLVYPMETMQ